MLSPLLFSKLYFYRVGTYASIWCDGSVLENIIIYIQSRPKLNTELRARKQQWADLTSCRADVLINQQFVDTSVLLQAKIFKLLATAKCAKCWTDCAGRKFELAAFVFFLASSARVFLIHEKTNQKSTS